MHRRLREQARSHIEMRSTVGAGLLAKAVWLSLMLLRLTRFCLFQKNFNPAIDLGSLPA
jgi:hypothetical protein